MSDDEQRAANVKGDKDRGKMNFSINLNSLLTLGVAGMIAAMWTDQRSMHDDVLTLKTQFPALSDRVQKTEGQIGSLWTYVGKIPVK